MKDIKIIFFDIDGTLIAMDKETISEKVLEALKRLQDRGIKLCIATGRGPMIVPHFDGVEFDTYLTFNGSYCYNEKETIYSNSIPKEDVEKLISNAAAMGKPVAIATKDRMAPNGEEDDLVAYFGFGNAKFKVAKDFEEVKKEEIYQVLMAIKKEQYEAALKDVKSAKITAWWDRAVDIIPVNGGKGLGIEKVLEYYGLDRSQALAFGDGNNDIEMFQAVGTGVAMANASDELKAISDEICGDVAEDGIYHYCIEKGLI